jgi:hypothetical protein
MITKDNVVEIERVIAFAMVPDELTAGLALLEAATDAQAGFYSMPRKHVGPLGQRMLSLGLSPLGIAIKKATREGTAAQLEDEDRTLLVVPLLAETFGERGCAGLVLSRQETFSKKERSLIGALAASRSRASTPA